MENTESKNVLISIDVEYKNACDYFGIEQDSIFITFPTGKEEIAKEMVSHCRSVLIEKYRTERMKEIREEIESFCDRKVEIIWLDEIRSKSVCGIKFPLHKKQNSWCREMYDKIVLGKPKDE